MSSPIYGSQNKVSFFRVVVDTAAYKLKKLNGTTDATSATDAFLTLDLNQKSAPAIDGVLAGCVFTQHKDDEALLAALKELAWIPGNSSAGPTAVDLEDGSQIFGASGSAPLVVCVIPGPKNSDSKIKTTAILGTLTSKSGSFTQESKNGTTPTFEIVGHKADYAVVLDDFLDSAIFDTADTLTIPAGMGFNIEFLTAA